jgi:hypothetical protein|tara:strand:+ start:1984 stop:2229 length:246 start_codon:yes stop_codon:yes gene_type:complete
MRYLIKSKRKHGNPEDFRWHRGYPDEPVVGIIEEPFIKTKYQAFEEFAGYYYMVNDAHLPIKDFDIHIVKSKEQEGNLIYE